MNIKKFLALLLALVMTLGMAPVAMAADDITVYASVSHEGEFVTGVGRTVIARVPVTVERGASIGDTFAALHEQYYGGEEGYDTADTQWGESVTTFWGMRSDSVSYYLNNASAAGLDVTVKNGDHLVFFFYQDTAGWSDAYTHFGSTAAALHTGDKLELTLTASTWQGSAPLEGAAITVDGTKTAVTTDEKGKATLLFDEEGVYMLSAEAPKGSVVVPPVCMVVVSVGDDTRMEQLMESIAADNTENTDQWVVMDMANYAGLGLSDARTSGKAGQAVIDEAIAALKSESAADVTIAKAILALTALGVDATELYAADGTRINAVERLNAVGHSASAWAAPYTLAAYNQGDWNTGGKEQLLVDTVLGHQQKDGSWSEWGDTIQTTANMIIGLSFYRDQKKVSSAIDRAVEYLSSAQADDGTYDGFGYGPDANTAAMVVLGLTAADVDPGTDKRFVKGGVSALDFLLSFAYEDGSGFGYQSNQKGGASDAYATQQAFRATIAAYGAMESGKAYNIYDFRHVPVKAGHESAAAMHPDVKKAAVTDPGKTFGDIDGHSAQNAIEALTQRGIITGKGDGSYYDPDTTMTRAEFAAIVVRALGLTPAETGAFTDVAAGEWYAPYAGTAHAYGIVNGTNDGTTFSPDDTITRQEAAVMVARAAGLCGLAADMDETAVTNLLAQFGDYTTVAGWAKESVAFCYGADILDQSDWDIRPAEAIKRHEIASMLYNLLKKAELL